MPLDRKLVGLWALPMMKAVELYQVLVCRELAKEVEVLVEVHRGDRCQMAPGLLPGRFATDWDQPR